jgi:hypothetical protein
MAGLDPAIQRTTEPYELLTRRLDARIKSGHDEKRAR